MAFRPRQPQENMEDYLRAKQAYEIQTTGTSGVDFGYGQGVPSPAQNTDNAYVQDTTGDPRFDAMIPILNEVLNRLSDNKQIINPNVQITLEKAAEFMSVAGREIDPYYSTQFKLAKDSLLKDLGYGTEDIVRFEQDTERKYGQQLRQLGETMATRGLAQSGIRQRAERELAQETQQQIEQNRRTLSRAAESTAGQFAQQYGGQAMPTPTITQAPRVLSGIGTFERPQGVSPLYNLSNEVYDNLIGAKQYEQESEKRRRASELESKFRADEERRLLSEIQ